MKILCADDEEDVRTILELALELDPSVKATVVDSGEALLARAGEGWDAFIVDGVMPGIDGLEVCRQLRANEDTALTPIIFLSGRTRREEVARALEAGATTTIAKPFDPMTLAADIKRVVGK